MSARRPIAASRSLAAQGSRWTDVEAHCAQAPHTSALPAPGSAAFAACPVRAGEERPTMPRLAFARTASSERMDEQRPHPDSREPQDDDREPAHAPIFPLIAGHAKQLWPARRRQLMDRMGHSSTRAAMIYMHGSDAHVAGAAHASRRVDPASVG